MFIDSSPEQFMNLIFPCRLFSEAGFTIARNIAQEVLRGTIAPYEGAKQIWHEVYTRIPELKELKLFVGLASEYEDDPKHREDYQRQIVEECEKLVSKAGKEKIEFH